MSSLDNEVTKFLDELNHPMRVEIEQLRQIISDAVKGLTENIKWNGPNYCFDGADRITMRIQPPGKLQLIFHRGAKKQQQPKETLIGASAPFLSWKENDRAIATFRNLAEVEEGKSSLTEIVRQWIEATK